MSNRHKDGTKANESSKNRTVHKRYVQDGENYTGKETTYKNPKLANPGNVIKCKVGGGHLGSKLAHENEAPFPEKLAEFFIRSFCLPGGIVLDPFCGSGTTCAVAEKAKRKWIGIDVRENQVELSNRRIKEARAGQGTLYD